MTASPALPPCHGLIAAWRLGPGGPAPLAEAEVGAALAAGLPAWLHFDLVDARARLFLGALDGLPEAARATLLDANPTVRLETEGEALFGALPDLHYEQEDPGVTGMGFLQVALVPRLLVTARRHPLRGAHAALSAPSAAAPPEAFAALVQAILGELGRVLAGHGQRLGAIEDAMLRPGGPRRRSELSELRRDLLRLSRHFGPLAEVVEVLREEAPDFAACAPLRREGRHMAASLRGLDGLAQRAHLAQEALDSAAAEETNRRLLVLSVISAAMLPATLVSGIFGMNVGGVPGVPAEGAEAGWGFAMALGLILASIAGTLISLRLARML